jgi:glucokinase
MIGALDIGATTVRAGIVSDSGELIATRERIIPPGQDARAFMDFTSKLLGSLAETGEHEVDAIGAGSCGVIREGTIVFSPNSSWKRLALAEALQARFLVPSFVINDADAFGLGVFHYEFAGKYKGICALTLGSGLGGSLIADGCAVSGISGISPEIGHMKIREGGAKCGCGAKGCLEAYVSRYGLMAAYRRNGGDRDALSPYDVTQAFRRGDKSAAKAYEELGHYLGVGMANVFNLFTPQAFIIGGGISRASAAFLPTAREAMIKNILDGLGPKPRLEISKLRSRASLLGAAHHARAQAQGGKIC